MKLKCHKSARL